METNGDRERSIIDIVLITEEDQPSNDSEEQEDSEREEQNLAKLKKRFVNISKQKLTWVQTETAMLG